MRQLLFFCHLLAPILGSGCAAMSRKTCCPKEKSAKTLLAWEAGPKDAKDDKKEDNDEKKDDEKNGKGKTEGEKNGSEESSEKDAEKPNGGELKEPEKDEIVTDRPDFTEASSTVGKGRIQLEAGYTYSKNNEANVQNSHSYPEALLRVGMFAEWFELRLGQNFSNSRSLGTDGGPFSISGGEDLYLGTKLGLTEQKKYLPEAAVVLQMTVPTGPKNLTTGKTLPGMNYLYSWEINDFLSIGASTQGNANVDDDGHTYLELAQSVTVGYTLTEKFGAYTEWYAFFPSGAVTPGTSAQHYFNGGFTYKVTSLFQLDIRAGKGLSKTVDDYFFGTGFAVKY